METVIPIDPQAIRRLRTERAWSQERLAEAAGLTPRTIQRLERDGRASPETRLALAAALDVDVSALGADVPAPSEPVAISRSTPKRLPAHFWVWAVASVLFITLDLRPDGSVDWAFYPILGWGIGVAFGVRKALRES